MKRLRYFVYSVVLGMIVGFGVEKATKRKKRVSLRALKIETILIKI